MNLPPTNPLDSLSLKERMAWEIYRGLRYSDHVEISDGGLISAEDWVFGAATCFIFAMEGRRVAQAEQENEARAKGTSTECGGTTEN